MSKHCAISSGAVTIRITRHTDIIISYESRDVHYLNTQSAIGLITMLDPSFVIIIISYDMPSSLPMNEADPSTFSAMSTQNVWTHNKVCLSSATAW